MIEDIRPIQPVKDFHVGKPEAVEMVFNEATSAPVPDGNSGGCCDNTPTGATCSGLLSPVTLSQGYKQFPTEALPDTLQRFVESASESIGCDASLIGLGALVTAASAIGGSHRIQIKRGWTEPSILWGTIVGLSGDLKTPALRAVVRPVREAQRISETIYTRELEAYERDSNQDTKAPLLRRVILGDATIEAIAPLLKENPAGRLLMFRDELAGWAKSFGQYKSGRGGDEQAWLGLYDGDPIVVDRRTGNQRALFVDSGGVSVLGGIQPSLLARIFKGEHTESGLFARLLLCYPPAQPPLWRDSEIPESIETAYRDTIMGLYDLAAGQDDYGNPRPKIIPMGSEAKGLFISWHDEHAHLMAQSQDGLRSCYSKIKGVACRLALVIHCVRVASKDTTIVTPSRVDAHTLRCALLLADWFRDEATLVYKFVREGEADRNERESVEEIESRGGSCSVRDWQRCRHHKTALKAHQDLENLIRAGYGRWEFVGKGKIFILCHTPCDSVTGDNTPPGDSATGGIVTEHRE